MISRILVYFINKLTGYKFAGYKSLNGENELSFWNAEDSRVDYLYVEADDYLFPIVRKIFKSEYTYEALLQKFEYWLKNDYKSILLSTENR